MKRRRSLFACLSATARTFVRLSRLEAPCVPDATLLPLRNSDAGWLAPRMAKPRTTTSLAAIEPPEMLRVPAPAVFQASTDGTPFVCARIQTPDLAPDVPKLEFRRCMNARQLVSTVVGTHTISPDACVCTPGLGRIRPLLPDAPKRMPGPSPFTERETVPFVLRPCKPTRSSGWPPSGQTMAFVRPPSQRPSISPLCCWSDGKSRSGRKATQFP